MGHLNLWSTVITRLTTKTSSKPCTTGHLCGETSGDQRTPGSKGQMSWRHHELQVMTVVWRHCDCDVIVMNRTFHRNILPLPGDKPCKTVLWHLALGEGQLLLYCLRLLSGHWQTSPTLENKHPIYHTINKGDTRFASSQWETALLCNDVSHWLAGCKPRITPDYR